MSRLLPCTVLFTICLQMMDYKTPIVLDTGSGLMKAGFSDEEHPNVIFPTIIGMPKYEVSVLISFISPRSCGISLSQPLLCIFRK